MRKTYKFSYINEDEQVREDGKAIFDTDAKEVNIQTGNDEVYISFDTIKQLNTQLEDIEKYGGNNASQEGK